MYLAEDRVLCLELIRKVGEKWLLRYIPNCIALTDPPSSIIALFKQRRRWINGSLFAAWHVIEKMSSIVYSKHSCWRKFSLMILSIYMLIYMVFSQLLVGSLFAFYSALVRSFFDSNTCGSNIAWYFEMFYLGLMFVFILMSITKPIERSQTAFTILALMFGVFMYISFGFGFVYFYTNQVTLISGLMMAICFVGVFTIPYWCNCLTNITKRQVYWIGVPIMLFLSPLYINMLITYSMANLHDISWGNRASSNTNKEKTLKDLEQFRSSYLIIWLAINVFYGYGMIYLNESGQTYYILVLTAFTTLTIVLKIIGCILLSWCYCRQICCRKKTTLKRDNNQRIENLNENDA